MTETDEPQGETQDRRVTPPTVPIKGINVPDPTTGSGPEGREPADGATSHEAFEKAKAESQRRA